MGGGRGGAVTAEQATEPRIVTTPGVCGGDPRLDGRRITVETVVGAWRCLGADMAAMAREYDLTAAQVRCALDYYAAHWAELERAWALDAIEDDAVRVVMAAAVEVVAAYGAEGPGTQRRVNRALGALEAAVTAWRRTTGQEAG